MKKITVKAFDKIIVSRLALLGIFSSCDNKTICEYGTPYAEFEIKGVVTDKATSQSIQGIRVVRQIYQQYGDTLYTDSEGRYSIKFGFYDDGRHLKFEDIDGEENGGYFEAKEIDVTITEADRVKKGDGWYEGKFVKTQNVQLDGVVAPEYGVPAATFKPIEP